MVNRWPEIFLCLLIWTLWTSSAAALTVQAVAGRDRIAVSESLLLQIRLDDIPETQPDFGPLQENWEILGRSQNSQRRIVNGKESRSQVYSLTLRPRRQGPLQIPPVCFEQECSQPLSIEVKDRSSLLLPVDEQVQLEAEVVPQQTAVMGQVLLRVRLALRVGLPEGQLSDPQPQGVHALVRPLGPGVVKHEKRDNGVLYQVLERDYALFPQESGEMRIPPLQYNGMVAGGPNRFDPFGKQGMTVRIRSLPLSVSVAPLPGDLAKRPWIPATAVTLPDDWQQQGPPLVVGEPATRTLRLRAPAFDLDWWDVSEGHWRTARIEAVTVEVAPAAGTAASMPPSAPASAEPKQPEMKPTATGFWPWLSLALAGAWVITLVLLINRRRRRQEPKSKSDDDNPASEKTARRAVIEAARRNDPQATRQMLVRWSQILDPKGRGGSYEHLLSTMPAEIRAELESLDRCLYGDSPEAWSGQCLAERLAEWRHDIKPKQPSGLPRLYPGEHSED
ncbi:MAG: BatD family protein [Desulfuromonadales bacterium]